MKKVLASSVVVLMVLFLSAGLGLAKNGKGGGNGGNGGGNGSGTGTSYVCDSERITISGTVSSETYFGSGLAINTGTEELPVKVTVYGIGPYWYWERELIGRPEAGEQVTVEGVVLDDGTIIAMSITVGGETIYLRTECVDGVGGLPLWRGSRNSN